jgi:two-component system nitrate/nitrite response regulator NarL
MDGLRMGNVPGGKGNLAGHVEAASAEGRARCRIIVVSDIRILREGLAEVLAKDISFSVVGIVGGLEEALEIAALQLAQIALVDAALPEGTNAVVRLRELSPGIQIIAFALSETEDEVIRWAQAGASGYVPRSAALSDLVTFVDCILRGEQMCSRRVAAGLLHRIAAGQSRPGRQSGREPQPILTARERDIVQCLGAGLSNKDIARRLNIGLATTKSHVHNVLNKLVLERRSQVPHWIRANASSLAPAREISPHPSALTQSDDSQGRSHLQNVYRLTE